MHAIEPIAVEDIHDPELRRLIERCEALGVPDSVFPRILARVPDYAKALLRALLLSHTEGAVDHNLKELIRIQRARAAGDTYFANLRSVRARLAGLDEETIAAASGDYEHDARFSEAEKSALRYARRMYEDPSAVDAALYADLKSYFSEAQIMELGAFIAFHYGMQVFMRTLDTSERRTQSARIGSSR
ncbi:MAG: carboxymuconolactone decarboxylase family protein [Burkholderiales bacterium]